MPPVFREGHQDVTNKRNSATYSGSANSSRKELAQPYHYSVDTVELVRQSTAYQQAKELMANYPDWIARLEAIAESAAVNQSAGPLEFLTNKLATKKDTAVSNAITEISNLIAQFTEWQNSLPSTQKSQLNAAGIYDTSGITSSGFTNNPTQPNSGVSLDNDSSAAIQAIVGAVSSIGGNFVGLLGTLGSIGLGIGNLKVNQFNAKTNRGKSGYEIISDVVGKGSMIKDPFETPFKENFPIALNSLHGSYSNRKAEIDYVGSLAEVKLAHERSYAIQEIYKDIAALQVDVYRQEYEARKASARYNKDFHNTASGVEVGSAANASARAQKARAKGDEIIEKHFNALVDKWSKKAADGSFVHALLLTNLRTSGNLGVQDAINTGVNAASKFIP